MDLLKLYNLESLKNEEKPITDIQDINEITFSYSTTFNERMVSMLKQMDNPYVFKNGDIIVKRNFHDDDDNNITLKEIFENYQNLNSY